MTRALLLLGSPKAARSTSGSFLDYLEGRLRAQGTMVNRFHLNQTMTVDRQVRSLLSAVDDADVIMLAFPLYVDGLPSNVLRGMEAVADRTQPTYGPRRPGFAVLCNGGFPEAAQSDTALATCRAFARVAGFAWLGGLAFGGGGVIDGRSLAALGLRVRNVTRSLNLAASALAERRAIPEEAVRLMAKPVVPHWMYRALGNAGWRRTAQTHGVRSRLGARPYSPLGPAGVRLLPAMVTAPQPEPHPKR